MFGIPRDAARAIWSAITRAKNLAAENVALPTRSMVGEGDNHTAQLM